jgi:hypothetical protein
MEPAEQYDTPTSSYAALSNRKWLNMHNEMALSTMLTTKVTELRNIGAFAVAYPGILFVADVVCSYQYLTCCVRRYTHTKP